MEDKNFAVLIDSENTSHQYLKTVFEEVAKLGVATVRRIYGDWTTQQSQSWKNHLLEYAVVPIQQYSYTSGKNCTDSAMIIDAMDLLYEDNVDGFCLVSSDSDFTRLAMRLREAGKTVIGMGKKQTPQPFVVACNQFKYLDLIAEQAEKKAKGHTKSETKPQIAQNKSTKAKVSAAKEAPKKEKKLSPAEEQKLRELKALEADIARIIEENSDDDGWIFAATIGSCLQKNNPAFDCRNYGHSKLVNLFEALDFPTEKRKLPNSPENSYNVYVKNKS